MKEIILKIKSDVMKILNQQTMIYVVLTACVLCSGMAAVMTFEPKMYEANSYEITDVSHYIDGGIIPEEHKEDIEANYKLSELNLSQETKSEIRNRRNAQKSKPIEIKHDRFSTLGNDGDIIALFENDSIYLVKLESHNDYNDSTVVNLIYVTLFLIFFLLFLYLIIKDVYGDLEGRTDDTAEALAQSYLKIISMSIPILLLSFFSLMLYILL
jgi:hypothetical protein